MTNYEVKLANGRTVTMAGDDEFHACKRAADLYQSDAIAWRFPRVAIIVGCQTTD